MPETSTWSARPTSSKVRGRPSFCCRVVESTRRTCQVRFPSGLKTLNRRCRRSTALIWPVTWRWGGPARVGVAGGAGAVWVGALRAAGGCVCVGAGAGGAGPRRRPAHRPGRRGAAAGAACTPPGPCCGRAVSLGRAGAGGAVPVGVGGAGLGGTGLGGTTTVTRGSTSGASGRGSAGGVGAGPAPGADGAPSGAPPAPWRGRAGRAADCGALPMVAPSAAQTPATWGARKASRRVTTTSPARLEAEKAPLCGRGSQARRRRASSVRSMRRYMSRRREVGGRATGTRWYSEEPERRSSRYSWQVTHSRTWWRTSWRCAASSSPS